MNVKSQRRPYPSVIRLREAARPLSTNLGEKLRGERPSDAAMIDYIATYVTRIDSIAQNTGEGVEIHASDYDKDGNEIRSASALGYGATLPDAFRNAMAKLMRAMPP